MDDGIKVVWYDLDREAKAGYLDWLHRVHLPELKSRPGYLWVAHYEVGTMEDYGAKGAEHRMVLSETDAPTVGRGTEYMLFVGAASPDVFFSKEERLYESRQSDETRQMLSRRRGARTCVFMEEARVNGPDFRGRVPGTAAAAISQFGSFSSVLPEDDFELGEWYRASRLPEMTHTAGSICTRKYVSVAGWPKHGILYEFTSLEAIKAWLAKGGGENAEKWTGRHVLDYVVHAPGSPSVGRRTWPKV